MNQKTFQAALKFVSHAAGKRGVRYCLNGVHFEFTGSRCYMVATDGHRLACSEIESSVPAGCATIGHDTIKLLLAQPKTAEGVNVCIEGGGITFGIAGQLITSKGIGGKFPDWRRIVAYQPEATSLIGVNAEYLAQAAAALAKVANRKYQGIKIHLQGPNKSMKLEAGLAGDHPGLTEAYCIVMPMRL